MEKIAVLIPSYNEGGTIEKVVRDWKKVLPEAVIYVCDNNSTDDAALRKRTSRILRQICRLFICWRK